jgi:hypothetical protein
MRNPSDFEALLIMIAIPAAVVIVLVLLFLLRAAIFGI